MGGIGSGQWYRWDSRSLTSQFRRLSIKRLVEEQVIKPEIQKRGSWGWWRDGEQVASIGYEVNTLLATPFLRLFYQANGEPHDYKVALTTTIPNYGGVRWWFRCPAKGCGRRVAVLYGGRIFACRHCYDLAYPCQQEAPHDRYLRKARKISESLGGEGELEYVPKPKGMHHKTYERKLQEMWYYSDLAEDCLNEHIARTMARMMGM